MTDPNQTAAPYVNGSNGNQGPPRRLAVYDGFTTVEDRSADPNIGLVSLGFIKIAIRRRARLWCTLAAAGFLVGCAYYVTSPPAYQATTSLLLTAGPYENINSAANNDQAMATSRTVAGMAAHTLGPSESAASVLSAYTATPITERVMRITFNASSSNAAIAGAGAVGQAFLQFRAEEMQAEQKLVLDSLNQQISQAEQHVSSLNAQVSTLAAQNGDPSRLKSLRNQRDQATVTLTGLQQAAVGNQTITQPATSAAVNGSVVLDPAVPLAHSRLKPLVLAAGVGLVMGLFLGWAIVVIQALVSDRLRRRDNVAQALGAPVRISVGKVRSSTSPLRRGGRSVTRDAEVMRIATHLDRTLPEETSSTAHLAVVAVDDLRVPAASVVSLALTHAQQGRRVVVVDLCRDAPAAKLLGVKGPGVQRADMSNAQIAVAVPQHDEIAPVGPLKHGSAMPAERSAFAEEVAAAFGSANLVLTLAVLDPSLGAEHLATWTGAAVAMVTAGQSSWTKIHGVGEMIRQSGTRLVSAVLIGADRTDDSLGVMPVPEMV